ncbi:MAG: hypothetical protein HZA54_13965 [Planctomycetes bacterium]|nr:hypothetical protein [Planctomycetota bacterium]
MDPKKLVMEHGEKIGLGAAALLLVLYVVFGFVLAGENTRIQGMNQLVGVVNEALQSTKTPPLESKPWLANARGPWESIEKPLESNDWTMYYQTKIVEVAVGERPVPVEGPKATVHKAPGLPDPTVDIGAVSLKWSRHKDTTCEIDEYLVMRKLEGGAKFEQIGRADGDKGKAAEGEVAEAVDILYLDAKVQPRKTYIYKIVSKTSDPLADKKEVESNEAKATATSTVAIFLKGGTATETQKIAQITVRKFFADSKDWKEQNYVVRVGDPIGKKERKYVGKESKEFDFVTGYILVDIMTEKRPIKRSITEKEYKDGVMVEVKKEITENQSALRMVVKDDEGKTVSQWIEEVAKPGASSGS